MEAFLMMCVENAEYHVIWITWTMLPVLFISIYRLVKKTQENSSGSY